MVDADNPGIHGYADAPPCAMLEEEHQCPAALAVEELLVGLNPSVAEAADEHEIFYEWDVNHWGIIE